MARYYTGHSFLKDAVTLGYCAVLCADTVHLFVLTVCKSLAAAKNLTENNQDK